MGAADLRLELEVGYGGLAAGLFSGPLILGALMEAGLLVASDRLERRSLVVLSLLAMAAGQVAMAFAPNAVALSVAIAFWGTATGVATGVAEGALAVRHQGEMDRMMARWGLSGALGDLCAPLLFGVVAALGLGWKSALLLSSGAALVGALAVALGPPLGAAQEEEEEEEPLLGALRAAWGARQGLLLWLGAAALCTLMDELLIAYGVLYLREVKGAGVLELSAQIAAFSVGAALNLLALDRALARWSATWIFCGTSAGCAAAFLAWLAAPDPRLGAAAMLALGFFTAPMWPLAQSRALSACPGRPGLVAALETPFMVVDFGAPLLIGALSDRFGLLAGLLLLLLQPLGVALIALIAARSRRSGVNSEDE